MPATTVAIDIEMGSEQRHQQVADSSETSVDCHPIGAALAFVTRVPLLVVLHPPLNRRANCGGHGPVVVWEVTVAVCEVAVLP